MDGVPITTYVSVAIVATALISALWQINKTGYFQRCCNRQKDPFANTTTFDTTAGINTPSTTTQPVPRVAAPSQPSIPKIETIQFQNEKTKKEFNKSVPRPPPMPAKTILPKSKIQEKSSGFPKSKPIKMSRW